MKIVKIDRRILKTRTEIKRVFLELLQIKEFEDIKVTEIAEQANIARKTFYLHYIDKYDLLDSIIDAHISELKKASAYSKEIDYNEAEFLWFKYIEENFNFFSKMLGSKSTEYFRNQFLIFLIDDINNDMKTLIKNEKDREVAVNFFSYGALGLLEWWLNSDYPENAEEISKRTGALYKSIIPDEYDSF
jgi:AcrR family transcriptional regulator